MQFPKQTRPVTPTPPCFLSTWPVCMPGICYSSAPQCSGHRRGKPCRSKFTKCSDGFSQKKNWKMVAGFNGLVVAGTGKNWYVRLIQGLHAKWTWFILAMHCGSLEFQSVFGHKTPLSSSSSSPITQLRATNAARHLGSFDIFFPMCNGNIFTRVLGPGLETR